MKLGETLLLRQQRYNAIYLPTVAIYLGPTKVGNFPWTKTIYQVKDFYPATSWLRDVIISYETLTFLREDYQTVEEWEEEQVIRQRLKQYCTR